MVRITNPQSIPLSYCKSICWHLGSCDSCELCQLVGVHVSCNHHLDVLAESNWIQLSTHCPPRLHAFLHLHPLLRDLAGPPKRGRAYFLAPMMLGLVVWHALSNRISDMGTSFTSTWAAGFAPWCLCHHTRTHLRQPRRLRHVCTWTSPDLGATPRQAPANSQTWAWEGNACGHEPWVWGALLCSTIEDDSWLMHISSQSHCSCHSAIKDVQLPHLELLGAQGSLSLWI